MAKINYTFLVQQETQSQVTNILKSYVLPTGGLNLEGFKSSHIGSSVTVSPVVKDGQPVLKEDGTQEVETRLDYERAFDILRWGKNESNPYSKQNPDTWQKDYDEAMALLQAEVKAGGVEVISRLPGRIASANKEQLVQFVQQARQEKVADVQAKIEAAKADKTRLYDKIKEKNEDIAKLQSELTTGGASLDREKEITELIATLTAEKSDLVTELETAIETEKTQTSIMTRTQKQQGKAEKEVKTALKRTLKREKKEAKAESKKSIKEFFKARKEAKREAKALKQVEKTVEKDPTATKPSKKTWKEKRAERKAAKVKAKEKTSTTPTHSDEALAELLKGPTPTADPNAAKEGELAADPNAAKNGELVADPNAAKNGELVADPNAAKNGEFVADPNAAKNGELVADPNAAKNGELAADPNAAKNGEFVADPNAELFKKLVETQNAAIEKDLGGQ